VIKAGRKRRRGVIDAPPDFMVESVQVAAYRVIRPSQLRDPGSKLHIISVPRRSAPLRAAEGRHGDRFCKTAAQLSLDGIRAFCQDALSTGSTMSLDRAKAAV
jgi:hypothetical protein